MYRYLRNTHLFLGLFCCLYLLMYGVSAVQMAHNTWFTSRPAVTETHVALPPHATDARPIARQLMDRYGLRGEAGSARAFRLEGAAHLSFNIVRPGTVYQIDYAPATGDTRIRDNHAGFIGMLNRIHHAGGLWHDYWLLNAWGAMVATVSAALIVLGGTGIYLWFKLHQERVVGAILLAVSLGYSLTLMVLARNAW
jgi:hypothetical protein